MAKSDTIVHSQGEVTSGPEYKILLACGQSVSRPFASSKEDRIFEDKGNGFTFSEYDPPSSTAASPANPADKYRVFFNYGEDTLEFDCIALAAKITSPDCPDIKKVSVNFIDNAYQVLDDNGHPMLAWKFDRGPGNGTPRILEGWAKKGSRGTCNNGFCPQELGRIRACGGSHPFRNQ